MLNSNETQEQAQQETLQPQKQNLILRSNCIYFSAFVEQFTRKLSYATTNYF